MALERKVDVATDIGDTLTPFSKGLKATPRQKHYNFDSYDGLGDSEEHINYFEQISWI